MKVNEFFNENLTDISISEDSITILKDVLTAHTEVGLHNHAWGQLNVINSGMIETDIEGGITLLAPWNYAIWIPSGLDHSSHNLKITEYCSVCIPINLCENLPKEACIINLTEIGRAIINTILRNNTSHLSGKKGGNLAAAFLDQLEDASKEMNYLPNSKDKYLKPILDYLKSNPDSNRTLHEWANIVYTSEKTLTRKFKSELNMSFREWRARLRFLNSLPLLKTNKTIQEISYSLGYSNTSSFIIMFDKLSGTTPEKYRKSIQTSS
ncbi:helix-turn-helix transcriptional regulator [Enterobacter hormaechei]|uniref:AraC family transcriptional regulator n=1 Tax=Enterobacter hormaechei TaxID=158836 RepID=UPI002664F748|nr:helix-turn-helix transcriptional regulator [Enterobacter hormaechei]MDO2398488.1 helix-turn-helix transcriptional regulator [Enterobacter hormaechei]MDO2406749.1 helix-turn-helix transcriptional regulator [Enterobacter hormaechei]MDO2417813.1 helix-turn-helix transcriptional regulator [Enterobacter hormaechei]MDO2427434.1 helix-turn-helix transcriptional regulator [Enterobacter hormaechei]